MKGTRTSQKGPSTKIQRRSKFQDPRSKHEGDRSSRDAWNSNHRTARKMGWSLAIGASLELGSWNLDLLRILVLGSSPNLGAWIFYCIPNFSANSSTIQFGLVACNA